MINALSCVSSHTHLRHVVNKLLQLKALAIFSCWLKAAAALGTGFDKIFVCLPFPHFVVFLALAVQWCFAIRIAWH